MGLFDLFKRKEMNMQTQVTNSPVNNTQISVQEQNAQNMIPTDISGSFVFQVEDVFTITGKGTVVTGRVLKGRVDINDFVTIKETGVSTTITGIEQFRKTLGYAQEGDNAGLLIRDIARDQISRGMHLVK